MVAAMAVAPLQLRLLPLHLVALQQLLLPLRLLVVVPPQLLLRLLLLAVSKAADLGGSGCAQWDSSDPQLPCAHSQLQGA
jgi:hypothetical protein